MNNHATRERAADLAALNFRVFPIKAGAKEPPLISPLRANGRVDDWWGHNPDHNIGIATGDGLLVLDVDTKDGRTVEEQLALLSMVYDELPPAPTVCTPSGGVHLYFRTDQQVASTRSKIAPGIDTRGHHGYVVAPGSVIDGKRYEWAPMLSPADLELPQAPQWLIDACGAPRERAADAQIPATELDTDEAVARATEYLKNVAQPAVEGDGGDLTTYRVACAVKDFGVSREMATDLMLDIYNERCSPPWDWDDLERKVENAYAYGVHKPGAAAPAADFEPVDIGNPVCASATRVRLPNELPPESLVLPLIEDFLDDGALSVMYGDSNAGKTFVALSMAYAIATGSPWAGKQTQQGLVVYVAAEAARTITRRIRALSLHHGRDDYGLGLLAEQPDLLTSPRDAESIIAAIREVEVRRSERCKLVVVDTLSRALGGGDENSVVDMGKLLKNVERIRAATGAHIMLVHHTGKDRAKGARGHSILRAAVDTELEIADGTVSTTKQRDREFSRPVKFELADYEVGELPSGDALVSAVAVFNPVDDFPPDTAGMTLTEAMERGILSWSAALILLAARNLTDMTDMSVVSVDGDAIVKEARRLLTDHDSATDMAVVRRARREAPRNPTDRTITRWRGHATDTGFLKKVGRNQWLVVDGHDGHPRTCP